MLLNAPPSQMVDAIIAYAIIVLLCFPIHEFGHAWVATRLGDTLALREGRVTLNPMAHIDPIGALVLAVAPFGWAKPVPFYPGNLRKAPNISVGIVMVSIAGIVLNLLMAAIFALPLRFNLVQNATVLDICFLIVRINLFLAVFNLIPVPPLDGSKILAELLPYRYRHVMDWLERYGIFVMLLLIVPLPGIGSLVGVLVTPIVNGLSGLMLGF
ncbi:MAG TPA: site-2 protease family protein, partial [Anaerolineae bacterium]|nr:site-2 protease family protein [Anaerolineae bacterium]